MITKIFYEEQRVHFADEDFNVYKTHFMKYGVSPMQFLRIMNICERRSFSPGQIILHQGTVNGLTIVRTGECIVHVNKEPTEIVGENLACRFFAQLRACDSSSGTFVAKDDKDTDIPEHACLGDIIAESEVETWWIPFEELLELVLAIQSF